LQGAVFDARKVLMKTLAVWILAALLFVGPFVFAAARKILTDHLDRSP